MNRINSNTRVSVSSDRLEVQFRGKFLGLKRVIALFLAIGFIIFASTTERTKLAMWSLWITAFFCLTIAMAMIRWFFFRKLTIDLSRDQLTVKRCFWFFNQSTLVQIDEISEKTFRLQPVLQSETFQLEVAQSSQAIIDIGSEKKLLMLRPYLNDFITLEEVNSSFD